MLIELKFTYDETVSWLAVNQFLQVQVLLGELLVKITWLADSCLLIAW